MMRRPIAALLASLTLAGAHAAEDLSADAPNTSQTEQQSLYQQALQALSEGRRTDASQLLRRLIGEAPRHAGAWLDLALIQCSLGNADEAERLFATVETRFAPSREILELIAQTREDGCHPWVANSTMSISFGRGHDRNVNQGASTSTLRLDGGAIELPLVDDFLPKHDSYTTGGLDYLRDVTPNGTIGFAQVQWRRNDHLHAWDTSSLFAGVESPWRFDRWAMRLTGAGGMVSLGGHLYQRQAQGQMRVEPPLSLPNNMLLNLMAGVTFNNYLRLDNFDSRTFELRPEWSYRAGGLSGSASLGLLDDHGDARRPGGNRHGQFLNLAVRRDLWRATSGELAYTRQTWRSARPYSPELLIPQIRNQATEVLRGKLTYLIDKHQSLQLEARAVRNRENIEIFQYNNRQLQLSWVWQP
ncbi:tetratricopeptide repeat protein [Massilia rhizosphaerae]|uniref:tetratricopeptide repeat protein n=1 Tax=Massilia rhizosphaerae TaxID=2784389 RepID=UPI001E6541B6|nr:tetratricopeptide repeat protein [Massilia rhizosphaerae]